MFNKNYKIEQSSLNQIHLQKDPAFKPDIIQS